jgi:hypothetical protein
MPPGAKTGGKPTADPEIAVSLLISISVLSAKAYNVENAQISRLYAQSGRTAVRPYK